MRGRVVARVAAVAAVVLAAAVAGCGGDDGGTDDDTGNGGTHDGGGGETVDQQSRRADDVAVEATATADGGTVVIELTVTNDGDVPVAVIDPTTTPDREMPLDGGAVQVTYLGPERGGGGEPLPPGEGVLLAPGESHSGTTRALTRGAEVPSEVEVCVEVVADFYEDDDNDGLVSFALRSSDDPPTLACSDRLTVT